jgi:hypothetical protein
MIRMKGDHHAKTASYFDAPNDVLTSRHRLSEATGREAKDAERCRLSEAKLCLRIPDSCGEWCRRVRRIPMTTAARSTGRGATVTRRCWQGMAKHISDKLTSVAKSLEFYHAKVGNDVSDHLTQR